MADRETESGLWAGIGGIAAILLGVALVPLRSITSASNLAFAFVALTIVVAEVGGRAAGLATAVVSAISLNFFLTEPYLTLTIDKPDDIVAFVALAVCGLIAAAFGRRRVQSSEQVSGARREFEVLQREAEAMAARAPLDDVLDDVRQSFRLEGIVLRRADETLVAAAPPEQARLTPPLTRIDRRTLMATESLRHRFGRRGFRLPEGGGRLLLGGNGQQFWLDLWEGDAEGLSADDGRALSVAIAMLDLTLRPGPMTSPGAAPSGQSWTRR